MVLNIKIVLFFLLRWKIGRVYVKYIKCRGEIEFRLFYWFICISKFCELVFLVKLNFVIYCVIYLINEKLVIFDLV